MQSKEPFNQDHNIMIISERGQRFRQALIDDNNLNVQHSKTIQNMQPPQTANKDLLQQSISQISLSRLSSKAQLSLLGIKQKDRLKEEILKDIDPVPNESSYLNSQFDKMTERVLVGRTLKEKSIAQINDQILGLKHKLVRITAKTQNNSWKKMNQILLNEPNLSYILEEEVADRMTVIKTIESRLSKMEDSMQNKKKINILQQIQSNMEFQKSMMQQQMGVPPDNHKIDYVEDEFGDIGYAQRQESRLKDYQKGKYEKYWQNKPVPKPFKKSIPFKNQQDMHNTQNASPMKLTQPTKFKTQNELSTVNTPKNISGDTSFQLV